MNYFSLLYVYSKEDFDQEVNWTISYLTKKGEGGLLTIDGYNIDYLDLLFKEVMYVSVFYCICFCVDRLTNMLKEQLREERYPDLNMGEDITLSENRENHWKDYVEENNNDKGKVRSLSWEV